MRNILITLLCIITGVSSIEAQVLYSTTSGGGLAGGGTICKYDATSKTLTSSFNFYADGKNPMYATPIQASNGKIYGMTKNGGNGENGTIFSFDPVFSIYTKLKDFDGSDGAGPQGSLMQASNGKLYGMTYFGGSIGGTTGNGVLFSIDPATNVYTKLLDFDGLNGSHPYGGLMQASDGKLYGMTAYGGLTGDGVMFTFDPITLEYTKILDFNGTNGSRPFGNLMQAKDGKLYGMTSEGGENGFYGYGVLFSYDISTLAYNKILDFDLNVTGAYPKGDLMQASDGKLYGMTEFSETFQTSTKNQFGLLFSFDPATSSYSKLLYFNGTNGARPSGNLMEAENSILYGMTTEGGSDNKGVLFAFNPSSLVYTKLKDFNSSDGTNPSGSLLQASDKKIYGMAAYGGNKYYDEGVLFQYSILSSAYMVKVNFGVSPNGNSPNGSLVKASNGKLYGMTMYGGNYNKGLIYSFDPLTSTYSKLMDFDGITGENPDGSLMQATDGKLYGMAGGGTYTNEGYGIIFSFDPLTLAYSKLFSFDGINGEHPTGNLIQATDGKLYGMTTSGGTYGLFGYGTVFSFDPITSAFTKLNDFDYLNGGNPNGSLIQASDGKLYGMTRNGGNGGSGIIFSFDLVTSTFTKRMDFGGTTGRNPLGSLMQAKDGKLYGMTFLGGSFYSGTMFSFDPITSAYSKLKDFKDANGKYPYGSLMQASDDKIYGMTSHGGTYDYGVAFSYDIPSADYTKLQDFDGTNGVTPQYVAFTEAASSTKIAIGISNQYIQEGNHGINPMYFLVKRNNLSREVVSVDYSTQDGTAKAGSDYLPKSGTITFHPGSKTAIIRVNILGDKLVEPNETFKVVLTNPINAKIARGTGIGKIINDDRASISSTMEDKFQQEKVLKLSPNPAQQFTTLNLTGTYGKVSILLTDLNGKSLWQKEAIEERTVQIPLSFIPDGTYLVIVKDEDSTKTLKLIKSK